jgi:ABC-type transport system involved in multi-copper enzyme maturation permease subunit
MAITNTEVYRRFEGEFRPHPLRFVPLFRSGVDVAVTRKLPLILFYAPPAIAGIVFSFIVHAKYTLEAQISGEDLDLSARIAATMAGQMVLVREQVIQSSEVIRAFTMLVIAWFGAGLIANDRRLGAHLLYFSRPMTRLDYFLGHFMTVGFFGLLAVLVPGLLVCTIAIFSSPEYSFLKHEWDVILATIGYSLVYVGTLSAMVMAVSSLVKRKAFALAGIFGIAAGSHPVGVVLWQLQRDKDFLLFSLWANFESLADWMFSSSDPQHDWNPMWSLSILLGLFGASVTVCAWRIRRMEVVA